MALEKPNIAVIQSILSAASFAVLVLWKQQQHRPQLTSATRHLRIEDQGSAPPLSPGSDRSNGGKLLDHCCSQPLFSVPQRISAKRCTTSLWSMHHQEGVRLSATKLHAERMHVIDTEICARCCVVASPKTFMYRSRYLMQPVN